MLGEKEKDGLGRLQVCSPGSRILTAASMSLAAPLDGLLMHEEDLTGLFNGLRRGEETLYWDLPCDLMEVVSGRGSLKPKEFISGSESPTLKDWPGNLLGFLVGL